MNKIVKLIGTSWHRYKLKKSVELETVTRHIQLIFMRHGKIDSIRVGFLPDNQCSSEKFYPGIVDEVSRQALVNIVNQYETEHENMNIENFIAMLEKGVEVEFIPEWYSQNNIWEKVDIPFMAIADIASISKIMNTYNPLIIKKLGKHKCALKVTKEVENQYSWRLDFSGKWPEVGR